MVHEYGHWLKPLKVKMKPLLEKTYDGTGHPTQRQQQMSRTGIQFLQLHTHKVQRPFSPKSRVDYLLYNDHVSVPLIVLRMYIAV
jgi:hypothetical protein